MRTFETSGQGLRRFLLPLVPIYATVIAMKGWLSERGVPRQRRLAHPVISVGSISAGGAGKTPFVIFLTQMLQRRGFEVRILTRGYGRSGRAILRVDPNGDAREFGDEPMLMARKLGPASVWVGIDRHRVGRVSEMADTPGAKVVYLLDDGFQHRKLARDVDIVLVTRKELEDRLLPAGNLREPVKAVRRAAIIVVREDEAEVARVAGPVPVWVIRRRLDFPEGVALLSKPIVFCGLARPEGFVAMLEAAGIVPTAVVRFHDHHAYGEEDIARLVDVAGTSGADGFVTTEKDAVKLTAAMMERLKSMGPMVVAELRVGLADEEARTEELLGMLRGASMGNGQVNAESLRD